jgi:hypothetical protein
MAHWPELRDTGWLSGLLGERPAAEYWRDIFEDTYQERNSSWAYRWTYAAWLHSGLTVLPAVNLVSNIGFGEHATHTLRRSSPFAALPRQPITFPLAHPPYIVREHEADRFTQQTMFRSPPLWKRVARPVYRALLKR